jgi:hypothetical protein
MRNKTKKNKLSLSDSMKNVNNELARESLGLLICSFIAILQYVIIIRKRIS